MESAKDDAKDNPVDASSPPAASSSALQSPSFDFMSSLSPLKSLKSAKYKQRTLGASSFSVPPPVFTSPHIDSHRRETGFVIRDVDGMSSSNSYGQLDPNSIPVLVPCSQKEVQPCTPPGSVGKYLADPEDGFFSVDVGTLRRANDASSDSKDVGELYNLGYDDHRTFNFDQLNGRDEFDVFQDQVSLGQQFEQNAAQVSQNLLQQDAGDQHGEWNFSCQSLPDFSRSAAEPLKDRPESSREAGMLHEDLVFSRAEETGISEPRQPNSRIQTATLQSTKQNAELVEELQQSSPKKRRRRSKSTASFKTCNCQRSKCLKLYCECFSAGEFCLDCCMCENCLNRSEYEDTVLETRQKMENRNPYAFTPKIVKPVNVSPVNVMLQGDGSCKTPASARHKRGCNCKRSKCTKRYCECYQARVGCCDGCRCNDCENPHGNKPESIYQAALYEKWKSSHQQPNPQTTVYCPTAAGPATTISPRWEQVTDIPRRAHPLPGLISPAQNHPGAAGAVASQNVRDRSAFPNYSLHPGGSLQPYDGQFYRQTSQPSQQPTSSPRIESEKLQSDNSPGSRSRRFTSTDVPSFPSLSPE